MTKQSAQFNEWRNSLPYESHGLKLAAYFIMANDSQKLKDNINRGRISKEDFTTVMQKAVSLGAHIPFGLSI